MAKYICRNCGHRSAEYSNFCPRCGMRTITAQYRNPRKRSPVSPAVIFAVVVLGLLMIWKLGPWRDAASRTGGPSSVLTNVGIGDLLGTALNRPFGNQIESRNLEKHIVIDNLESSDGRFVTEDGTTWFVTTVKNRFDHPVSFVQVCTFYDKDDVPVAQTYELVTDLVQNDAAEIRMDMEDVDTEQIRNYASSYIFAEPDRLSVFPGLFQERSGGTLYNQVCLYNGRDEAFSGTVQIFYYDEEEEELLRVTVPVKTIRPGHIKVFRVEGDKRINPDKIAKVSYLELP